MIKSKTFKLTSLGLALISGLLLTGCMNNQKKNNTSHYHTEKVAHKAHSMNRYHYINYNKPSENKPYPKLNAKTNRAVVSIKHQRVYLQQLKNHQWKTIYTMFASTGSHNRTPAGKYHIQNVRGNYFYSNQEHEGARYYVSWKDNGVYLFHATPNNQKKQINVKVAHDLGRKPSSHGCVHLTIPDAKYMSKNAPTGMTVLISKD